MQKTRKDTQDNSACDRRVCSLILICRLAPFLNMEKLIEVDRDKWVELRDLYRKDWPKNVVASSILDTNISCPDLSKESNFKVYCPEGNIHNGMVATSEKNNFIRVHPLNGIEKMEKALETTKVIDWNRPINVVFASREVDECFKRLGERFGLEIRGEVGFKHVLHRESPLVENMRLPNTYIAEPKHEDLQIIDKTWTFRGPNSLKYFEALARNHLLFALYSDNGNLLAWVGINHEGHLTHLFCLEEHRRKGYAECILRYVVNNQLKNGKDLLAYTYERNIKAKQLFDKLKFERLEWDRWLFMMKIKNES